HSLEAVDYPVEITAVVQRARRIDHVAQLLRLDPHLVYGVRRSFVMDRYSPIDQAAIETQDTPRGYLDQRTRSSRRFGRSWRCLLRKALPIRQQGSVAVAFEKPLQQALFVELLTAEEGE